MRKLLLVIYTIIVSACLSSCLGQLAEQAQQGQAGVTEAQFETYSQIAMAENGSSRITLNNTFATPTWLKITVAEDPAAWRLYEIPAHDREQIELGAQEYILQLINRDTGTATSNALHILSGDATIEIGNGYGFEFDLFIPDAE